MLELPPTPPVAHVRYESAPGPAAQAVQLVTTPIFASTNAPEAQAPSQAAAQAQDKSPAQIKQEQAAKILAVFAKYSPTIFDDLAAQRVQGPTLASLVNDLRRECLIPPQAAIGVACKSDQKGGGTLDLLQGSTLLTRIKIVSGPIDEGSKSVRGLRFEELGLFPDTEFMRAEQRNVLGEAVFSLLIAKDSVTGRQRAATVIDLCQASPVQGGEFVALRDGLREALGLPVGGNYRLISEVKIVQNKLLPRESLPLFQVSFFEDVPGASQPTLHLKISVNPRAITADGDLAGGALELISLPASLEGWKIPTAPGTGR